MKIDHATFTKMPEHIRTMFIQLPDPVVAMFPQTTSGSGNKNTGNRANGVTIGHGLGKGNGNVIGGDSGSAARFFHQFTPDADPLFYHPKAGKQDRAGSKHPTVKPIALMQYLIRHITPPGGVVLDPFAGSGTTAEAARREGFDCILMEAEPEYLDFLHERFGITPDHSPGDHNEVLHNFLQLLGLGLP